MASVFALVLLASACADDEKPTTAYKLATLDGESPGSNSDAVVVDYQKALDAAAADCTQSVDPVGDTPGVGDLAVVMNEQQPEKWTILAALRGIAEAVRAELAPTDCVDIATSLLVISDG